MQNKDKVNRIIKLAIDDGVISGIYRGGRENSSILSDILRAVEKVMQEI